MTSFKTRCFRLAPVAGALAFLAACSSDPTLYTLAAFPGPAVSASIAGPDPMVVEVRTPVVSARLDRDTIVRASADYKTKLASGTSWSEALPDMIGHTLATDLAQRLPGTIVFSEGDAVTSPPAAYVELTLRNFEADSAGHAVVTGMLSVHTKGASAGSTLTAPISWVSPKSVDHDVSALVAGLSQGVAAIADQAAMKLRSLPQPLAP